MWESTLTEQQADNQTDKDTFKYVTEQIRHMSTHTHRPALVCAVRRIWEENNTPRKRNFPREATTRIFWPISLDTTPWWINVGQWWSHRRSHTFQNRLEIWADSSSDNSRTYANHQLIKWGVIDGSACHQQNVRKSDITRVTGRRSINIFSSLTISGFGHLVGKNLAPRRVSFCRTYV